MLILARCNECQNELSWNYGEHKEFILKIEKNVDCCDKCGRTRTEKQEFHFCSYKCLKNFILKFEDKEKSPKLSKNWGKVNGKKF